MVDNEQLPSMASVLMGVAYADGFFLDCERDRVESFLKELAGGKALDAAVIDRIASFEPDGFDLDAVCAELRLDAATREKFLATMVEIADSDEFRDVREEEYIERVGTALGAKADELAALLR